MIELRIQGQAVDVAPDTKITLNFNSNIFGDISKIEASNSFTIALPKTVRNRAIFGTPALGNSTAPYRRWEAELIVNGIKMIETAYAVFLSESENYDIALYWGVVTSLSTLKENDKTIAELSEVLQIQYGAPDEKDWWTSWNSKAGETLDGTVSSNILNALYEAGIEDLQNNATARKQAALLPSVRASWVWDSIVKDNALNIEVHSQLKSFISALAVPFTTHKVTGVEGFVLSFLKKQTKKSTNAVATTFHTVTDYPINAYFEFVTKQVPIYVGTRKKNFDATIFQSKADGRVRLVFNYGAEVRPNSYGSFFIEHRNSDNLYYSYVTAPITTAGRATIECNVTEGDYILPYVRWSTFGAKEDTEGVDVRFVSVEINTFFEDEKEQVMGGMINTRDNLPDISQLDFVKAMCAMRGMWATLIDGVVHIVPYSVLYTNAPIDWSYKLVGTADASAKNSTFTLGDYAQRNILRYKEDDATPIDASGALLVDNETIDKEKDMLTLPFAASEGNVIPHLKWKDDDSSSNEVEEVTVEPRVMFLRTNYSLNGNTWELEFGNLSFTKLISNYYKEWQNIMRNPIVIEEQVRLSEIDIKDLDYRRPIYLQKYGALFAINKVLWSEGEPSTVTLVKLPPAQNIGVALPYKVTTGVTVGSTFEGVENNPIEGLSYLVEGAGQYFGNSAVLFFDESKANKAGISFSAWVNDAGIELSKDNPFVYDGENGDLTVYANTFEILEID